MFSSSIPISFIFLASLGSCQYFPRDYSQSNSSESHIQSVLPPLPSKMRSEDVYGSWRFLFDGRPDAASLVTCVLKGKAMGAFREQKMSWSFDEGVFQMHEDHCGSKTEYLGRFASRGVLQGTYHRLGHERRGTWIAYKSMGIYDETPSPITDESLVVLSDGIYRRTQVDGHEVLILIAVIHK